MCVLSVYKTCQMRKHLFWKKQGILRKVLLDKQDLVVASNSSDDAGVGGKVKVYVRRRRMLVWGTGML